MPPNRRFHVLAGIGGDALEALAALADDHGLVRRPVDDHGGVDAPQVAFLLELLDLDGDAVGQFLAEVAEQLFAQHFGGQEAFGAVGDVVGVEYRRAPPAGTCAAVLSSSSSPRRFSALTGTMSAKAMLAG